MKLAHYEKLYNGAPMNLTGFAYAASTVEDCGKLSFAANQYIEAKEAFEAELERINVELG